MKLKTLKLFVAAVVLVILVVGCGHPDLAATSVADPRVHLTSDTIKGKVTLIDFWATWCGPCIGSMPDIQSIYDDYHDKGVLVYGITTDDAGTVKNFLEGKSYTYPMYSDDGGVTSAGFGIDAIPHLVIIGKGGGIVLSEEGAPIDKAKVRKALDDALAG